MKQEVIDIRGYRGLPIPNTLIRQGRHDSRLAILFPGLTYRNTMPALYYPRQLLLARGYDVLTVDYAYDLAPEFMASPEEDKVTWIGADARATLEAVFSLGRYERFTLVGKSLGTAAMAYTVPDEPRLVSADLIWLTPGFRTLGVPERMARCPQRSIIMLGTADPHYGETYVAAARGRGAEVVLLPGLNHGLEVPSDIPASIVAMKEIVERLSLWLPRGG